MTENRNINSTHFSCFKTEQDEPRTAEDKVLTGLNLLRSKLSDVVSDQVDLKEDVREVRLLVNQARHDSRLHTDVSGVE